MSIIDFSIPYWLVYCYHIIGSLSLVCDVFAIYLILFKSSKIDNFRYFLLNFQIVCCLFDIHLTLVMQPVPLYPLVAGYVLGVSTYIGGTMYHCMLICIALIVYQVESIVFCFVKKHQTIANTLKKYIIPNSLVWLLFTFFVSALCGVLAFFSRTTVAPNDTWAYMKENFPEHLNSSQSLPNFTIYNADAYFITVVLAAVSMGIFSFSILCLIILNIFRMLSMLKTQISTANYQKHRVAILSLLAQFATSSVCFVPPIIYVFVVLIGVNGAQLIVEYLLVVACLHSPLNASVLVLTFPPYRKFVMSLLKQKTSEVSAGINLIAFKPSSIVISHQ